MSKKVEPLFRVSCIIQGAESLDNALRAINGLTIHPPLTEPYQEIPVKIKPETTVKFVNRIPLSEVIHQRLLEGSCHQSEMGEICKEHKFSRGNVAKVARKIGATFDRHTKSWSLSK